MGHRKLLNVPVLTAGVTSAIEQIQHMSPSLTKTPIGPTVLSPLAEGADELVTRQILKVPASSLEVILPMDKDHYLEDFLTEQFKKEFEEVLALATSVRQQPLRGDKAE